MDLAEQRKAETRALGAAYFEKVLAEANAGKDPFKAKEAVKPLPPAPRRANRDAELGAPFDEDLEAVGAVLRGSRLYVLLAAKTFTTGASLVLVKQALGALAAPCLMVALHSLPAVLLLLFLHCWSGSPAAISKLSPEVLKGSVPRVALHTVQVLALFMALPGAGVCLVLSWTLALPLVLQLQLSLPGSFPEGATIRKAGCGLGLVGVALSLVASGWPGPTPLLSLALWAAAEGGRCAWPLLCSRAQAGQPVVLGNYSVNPNVIQQVREAENAVDSFTLAFLQNAAPCALACALGLILLEGRQLVGHELSVPAVTGILLSAVCWGLAEVAAALLAGGSGGDADFMPAGQLAEGAQMAPIQQLALKSTSAVIALVLQHMVLGQDGPLAGLGLIAAAAGSALLQFGTATTAPG